MRRLSVGSSRQTNEKRIYCCSAVTRADPVTVHIVENRHGIIQITKKCELVKFAGHAKTCAVSLVKREREPTRRPCGTGKDSKELQKR